ncbi:MAG: alpha/beta hydrolase fold domain-containing protein [Planctomycetota bacterium]|nr:alpha/beta hydrolase fold domain-containing protein [Planctomycetota bacterium]MDA1248270.1 alpha/beta hydrolase fold domain-containing protein [Planctomycetota bacterium]
MSRALLVTAVLFCLASLPSRSDIAAEELTVGEQGVMQAISGPASFVRLWPVGKMPDEDSADREETFQKVQVHREALVIRHTTQPSFLFLPAPASVNPGVCVLLCPPAICPQARFSSVDFDPALAAAKLLNERGISVAVLKYRPAIRSTDLPRHHAALQDAQRAMSVLTARADEWKIDPEKIGVGGFSAGALLAGLAANHSSERAYKAVDKMDEARVRPAFSLMLAPFLTRQLNSRELLPELKLDELSSKATPPVFLAFADQDRRSPGPVQYALWLRSAGVRFELHSYPDRRKLQPEPADWSDDFHRWLGDVQIVKGEPRPKPFEFKAASLPAEVPFDSKLTEADQTLRLILGRDCPVIPIWPTGTGPDEHKAIEKETATARSRGGKALNIGNVTRPTLTVVAPLDKAKSTGTVDHSKRAVIVCPGGGYGGLAAEHEGTRVCEWLNEMGITAFLLKYRVPRRGGEFPKHHHALQDAQRAIRIVRSRAAEWGIDPAQIGFLGFSAGGHLVTSLCVNWNSDSYTKIDKVDETSSRPDFGIPIYPAYLTDPVKSDNVDRFCADGLDVKETPPMFLAIARDDVFAQGMLNFYFPIQKARVPVEIHIFGSGGHGGGNDPGSYPCSEWTKACWKWLDHLAEK